MLKLQFVTLEEMQTMKLKKMKMICYSEDEAKTYEDDVQN